MRQKVVVVGSGLAGSLLCNELAAAADVTLLEIGDESSISYPKVEYGQREFGGVRTFCYGGGGTTNLWHNGLIPINPADVSSTAFRTVLAEARPFTDAAAASLFFPTRHYSDAYARAVAEAMRMGAELGVFDYGLDCLLYPKKYTRLRVEPKVQAFYGVRNLDFALRAGTIERISFTVGTSRRQVAPDVVAICAGALGSPRLVKEILAAAGDIVEQPGTGLMDHPLGFIGKVRIKERYRASFRAFASLDKGGYECCTAARIKSACGHYTCVAFFRPALTMANDLAIYKYKSLLGANRGVARLRHLFSPKIFSPDILAEIFSHVAGAHIPSRIFNILVYFEQRRGRNRVAYDGEVLRVDWRISDEEIAVYNEMLGTLRKMLVPLADELNMQAPISEDWLWSGAHHSGTLSLGDAGNELLDTDLRLRRCANAFVCDASVIQEHSYANTGLTIGQLALRLASTILARPS